MGGTYKDVLVAIDGSEESRCVLSRAAAIVDGSGGRLHLLHVIEPLALAYGADVPMDVTDLQASLMQQARENIDLYAGEFRVPPTQVHVELGSIEKTIQDKADMLGADLIVIGSHTRTGLALLLGSTARGVVPGAHCDVLAVKIPRS
ncbi:universal stress protein [Alcanivorax sp. JB21]|uniref:universal stress protein n=1 Tax=Alcanivorax limicola TaxID=2874102 RepID=UPI001CC061A9|nr:universal stress protein [Alcanivorax limicola]MBZ2188056.1 universal stress protein [Alcanivorax limicola]